MNSLSDSKKACYVRAEDVVILPMVLLGVVNTIAVNRVHDLLEFLIHHMKGPVLKGCVLLHFQGRDGDTTGIGSFGRAKKDFLFLKNFNGGWC